jgi:glycosyltransferase involved in cell wall biosynthesis
MNILHLSGSTGWGGNEQQLVDLVYGLEKIHVSNTLFCFKDSSLEIYAKENNIKYYSIPKVKAYALKYAKFLNNYVKKHQPDVIHIHTSNSVTAFVIADIIYKLKTPTIFSKKGIGGSTSKLSIFKYNYKNINKIVCVSKAVKDAFKTVVKSANHHKLCVVYDGIKVERSEHKSTVNLREHFSIERSKILIGNIANHTRAKDLVTLVKTANELVHTLGIKNIHFIQIGKTGKYSNEFLPLIQEYNLDSFFTVTGFLDNAMDLLTQLDLYLMTSEREGLPITIYEAFLKKTPIVTTAAGGIPEAIIHGENGMLSDVKDFSSLALNLKKLITDKPLQESFAEKSYKLLFEKFTTIQLAENTFSIYKDLIKND